MKLDFLTHLLAGFLYCGFFIGMFVYLIHLRNAGTISVGSIAFILSMTYVFADNVWFLGEEVNKFIGNWADFKAAFSIMEVPQNSLDKPDAAALKVSRGEIRFKNVKFGYGAGSEKTVFAGFNLNIPGGQKIGLVGHSGAGKSTLISLLLKNFPVTSGDILIDGQNIADVTSDSLRSHISLIPQDIMLFHRSIGENIGYAKPKATQREIEDAARKANIHDFIAGLPQGYKTLVGERGLKLSGGQRQRVAIARAILKNAPILILDEATSNLDSETESRIQESINAMLETNHATVIAIAHRLSTIRHMDRIVVMEAGRIVEDGSFDELIQRKAGKFKQLWDHQVNGMVV